MVDGTGLENQQTERSREFESHTLCMKTIYITGIRNYKKGIRKALDKSDLVEGYDFIEGLDSPDFALIWINENIGLRTFKHVMGVKYVWKHRLRFYNSIDEMKPKTSNDELSENDIEIMNRFKETFAV